MNLTMLILAVLAVYMFLKVHTMSVRNKEIGQVLKMMDHLDNAEEFYRLADEEVQNARTGEYRNKALTLKLFGDAYFRRQDQFRADLEQLDPEPLYMQNGKQNIIFNEDSFFYLFLAIPNKLFHTDSTELIEPLFTKMDAYADPLDELLVSKLGHEAKKYYLHTDDLGKTFFKQFLDGEYAGYRYNTQLIGIYKNIAMAFLTRFAMDEGQEGIPEEYADEMRIFAQSTLGKRWLEELAITIPSSEPEETQEEDEEQLSGS